jgi:hypothetical protein
MKKIMMPLNRPLNDGHGHFVSAPPAALSTSTAPYPPHDLRQAPLTGNGKEVLT